MLEVVHERISPTLHLDEVEVHLQLETRGAPHAEQVLARLRERGYRVVRVADSTRVCADSAMRGQPV